MVWFDPVHQLSVASPRRLPVLPQITFLQMLAQFLGGILIAWYIIEEWKYWAYWCVVAVFSLLSQAAVPTRLGFCVRCRYIWGFCSFLPALAEIGMLVLTFGFKIYEY